MTEDVLKHYTHAMTIDSETGKPMIKVAIATGSEGTSQDGGNDTPTAGGTPVGGRLIKKAI